MRLEAGLQNTFRASDEAGREDGRPAVPWREARGRHRRVAAGSVFVGGVRRVYAPMGSPRGSSGDAAASATATVVFAVSSDAPTAIPEDRFALSATHVLRGAAGARQASVRGAGHLLAKFSMLVLFLSAVTARCTQLSGQNPFQNLFSQPQQAD